MLKLLFLIFFFDSTVKEGIGESVWNDASSKSDGTVGGHDVDIKKYPYHVSLVKMETYHFCGGSIISPDYVLTAAHCLKYIEEEDDLKNYNIRAGSSFYNKSGDIYNILSLAWNPQFNSEIPANDVGIIKTEKMTINGVTTKVVQLPEAGSALKSGATIVVTGWGFTNYEGNAAAVLQAVSVPAISPQQCNKMVANISITDRVFCGRSSASAEPGGPVVEESSLIQYGIVMFGGWDVINQTFIERPEVYTYVPTVRDWIKEQTGI